MKALVPDTNVWLHARLPVNFAAIAGAQDFVVVVPRRVLNELDAKQHEGRAVLRKRARLVLLELRAILQSGGVGQDGRMEGRDSAGVEHWLVMDAQMPTGASADDVIVATAGGLVAAGVVPMVVTGDAAMQMTARLTGLSVHVLSPAELEADENDPLEQKVAALERQVKVLQDPQPLIVQVVAQTLWPETNPPELVRLQQPTDAQLEDFRRQVQVRMQVPGSSNAPWAFTDARGYLEAVPDYARRFAEYLRQRARWEASAEAAVQVQMLVINRTQRPVSDAVLEVRAPDHVTFELPPRPDPPAPPKKPDEAAISGLLGAAGLSQSFVSTGAFSGLALPPVTAVPHGGPKVRTEPHWAEMRLAEPLRPDHEAFAGRLWIVFEPEFAGEEVTVPYTLYSAAAGKPVSGTFTVRVAWREEGWGAPALPEYQNPQVEDFKRPHQMERQSRKCYR